MKLEVGNSFSKLSGLTNQQLSGLKTVLSYESDPQASYFSGNFRNSTRYLIDKHGSFPTGLLCLAEDWLIQNHINYTKSDKRVRPYPTARFNLKLPVIPYPEQTDAVASLIAHSRGTISACTGFGKSVVIAMIIQELQVKTLIIVPNLQLKQQLKETLTQYFGNLDNITVENIAATSLNNPGDYNCLIIDEAHHVAAKTYRNLNKKHWGGIFHRVFLTATPFRSKDEEQMLYESIAGQVIYRIDYKDAMSRGYVVPVDAYYIDLPKVKTDAYTWAEVYAQLVTKNEYRNNLIANLLIKLEASSISTLCLVKEIAHGDSILKYILRVTNDDRVAFVKGENDSNKHTIDLFNNTVIRLLIGTTGILGEGVDTRPAEFVIIAGLGKSKNQFMQSIGRGLRAHPNKSSAKIILFRDPSHKYTLRHYNSQKKILLDEYGVIPVRLEI